MVYVHLATGFEEVEALTIVDILRRAGVEVQTVSITGEKLVMGTHDIGVEADLLYEETDYEACEMIVLPGGLPGASNLEAHEGLTNHIKCFAANGKKATIYPGMEDRLIGAEATGEGVTKDGNIITGKGPAYAMEFALALAEELQGKETAASVAEGLLYRG